MKGKTCCAIACASLWGWLPCRAQLPEVRPQVVGSAVVEGRVTTVRLAPHFATAIRMPDTVNSVLLGDPASFAAEHSEKEPQIVFVKPITDKPAQSNLLISTVHGLEANLLLISRGETPPGTPPVDFLLRFRPAGHFLIAESDVSGAIAQTRDLKQDEDTAAKQARNQLPATAASEARFLPASFSQNAEGTPTLTPELALRSPEARYKRPELDRLLDRQRHAPLPALYGEKPGVSEPGKQILKAGVSETIDQGKEVVVLFSAVNVQKHAVQLMPPQIQLAGKIKKGKLIRHKLWSNSEQLPVQEFLMSRRRLGPGERTDGVLVFERPGFKQSNETVLLQIADSGAVDRPALAPIGFGISSLRKEGGE